MAHYEAKLSTKGQVTIPVGVRAFFQLKEGDIVDFYVDDRTGVVRILARNIKLSDWERPPSPHVGPAATIEDIDEAIGQHLGEDDERITRDWCELMEFRAWKAAKSRKAAE